MVSPAPQKPQSTPHYYWLVKSDHQVQARAVNFASCTGRLEDAVKSDLDIFSLSLSFPPVNSLTNASRRTRYCHRKPLQFARHTEEVRLTHQIHQHEHFRLSHPTPEAVPRGHDAVATSGYAGAIGFPWILEHGARLLGKCSFCEYPVGGGTPPSSDTPSCFWDSNECKYYSLHDLYFISIMQPYCKIINYTRR